MSERKLTPLEIRNLISLYDSELKKLYYQFTKTQATIAELEESLQAHGDQDSTLSISMESKPAEKPKEEKPKAGTVKKKRGPGRPPKSTKSASSAKPKAKKKAKPKARKRKRKSTGGYRLSDWDKFIIATIQENDKPTINREIFAEAKKAFPSTSDDEIKGKISRSLFKLANRRHILIKQKFEGRGFAYTINPSATWE